MGLISAGPVGLGVSCQCPRTREEKSPTLGEFRPSAKLVYLTVRYKGPLTQLELIEETELARQTVRSALSDLETAGFLASQPYEHDRRQRQYRTREE